MRSLCATNFSNSGHFNSWTRRMSVQGRSPSARWISALTLDSSAVHRVAERVDLHPRRRASRGRRGARHGQTRLHLRRSYKPHIRQPRCRKFHKTFVGFGCDWLDEKDGVQGQIAASNSRGISGQCNSPESLMTIDVSPDPVLSLILESLVELRCGRDTVFLTAFLLWALCWPG